VHYTYRSLVRDLIVGFERMFFNSPCQGPEGWTFDPYTGAFNGDLADAAVYAEFLIVHKREGDVTDPSGAHAVVLNGPCDCDEPLLERAQMGVAQCQKCLGYREVL